MFTSPSSVIRAPMCLSIFKVHPMFLPRPGRHLSHGPRRTLTRPDATTSTRSRIASVLPPSSSVTFPGDLLPILNLHL